MRKLLGGTMRQSGMLAAAALYALENNVARLAEDHRRTRDLEAGLTAMGYEVTEPETNMVYIDVPDGAKAQDDLEALGVRCFAADATTLRLVVHLHVTDEDVQTTLNAFQKLAAQT
jgi:threonine aldolase